MTKQILKKTKYCINKATVMHLAIYSAAAIFLSLFIMSSTALKNQEEISKSVLRLHVIANSNTEEDQSLKLKVRDALIAAVKNSLPQNATKFETINWCEKNLSKLQSLCNDVIKSNGYNYPVSCEITRSYFPTKEYESMRLSAGDYTAFKVEIGKAQGENWWCVMFPSLCFSSSAETNTLLNETLSTPASKMIEYPDADKINVKFKVVEWFEKLFKD